MPFVWFLASWAVVCYVGYTYGWTAFLLILFSKFLMVLAVSTDEPDRTDNN